MTAFIINQLTFWPQLHPAAQGGNHFPVRHLYECKATSRLRPSTWVMLTWQLPSLSTSHNSLENTSAIGLALKATLFRLLLHWFEIQILPQTEWLFTLWCVHKNCHTASRNSSQDSFKLNVLNGIASEYIFLSIHTCTHRHSLKILFTWI